MHILTPQDSSQIISTSRPPRPRQEEMPPLTAGQGFLSFSPSHHPPLNFIPISNILLSLWISSA